MHELKRLMWTVIREHDHTKHIKICNSNLAIFTQCWNFVIISPHSFGHLSIVKINTEKSSNVYLIFAYNVCETDPCCALLFFKLLQTVPDTTKKTPANSKLVSRIDLNVCTVLVTINLSIIRCYFIEMPFFSFVSDFVFVSHLTLALSITLKPKTHRTSTMVGRSPIPYRVISIWLM